MFTGLVQAVGEVVSVEPRGDLKRLWISLADWNHAPDPGDSISVSGCCLTVAAVDRPNRRAAFDAIPETISCTTLGQWTPGRRVNLEHALSASALLGGHLVQGHVDGIGRILAVTEDRAANEWRLRIQPIPSQSATPDPHRPFGLMQYVTPKGSIAVDGVSLTVAALSTGDSPHQPDAWFEVALIPVTLARTTLSERRVGDLVNLEADPLAKTLVHWLQHYGTRLLAR